MLSRTSTACGAVSIRLGRRLKFRGRRGDAGYPLLSETFVSMVALPVPNAELSPFAEGYEELLACGFHPIPVLPRDKAPGERSNGRWRALTAWPQFKDRAPTVFEITAWKSWAEANIGVVVGTAIGPHKLLVVDIDSHDPDEVNEIRSAIPASPMVKTGAKGASLFFRAPVTLTSKGYNIKGKRVVDLLASGRQTVMPPSVHPHGPTYRWLAGPVPAHELPLFDETCLERLEDTLAHLGWGGDVAEQARVSRKPMDRHDDDPSVWQEVNEAAMSNMGAWVPALDLYGCRPVQRGGYEAVATWRPSGSGERLEKRKRNLKIFPDGIRDFGADVGYSPLDLVCAANNWALDDAFRWLKDRLEFNEEPVFVVAESTLPPPPAPRMEPVNEKSSGAFPKHLLQVPGLVGEIADFITSTANRPQPLLSLGSALAIVGTAGGKVYGGPTYSSLPLYILALAESGTGKEHVLSSCTSILNRALGEDYVGPGSFMSFSSVIRVLQRSRPTLCPMDEFGSFLKRIKNPKAGGFETAITGALRSAWGINFGSMPTPEWAQTRSTLLHSPCMSIYGASTPEDFYESLESEDIGNGFLNRFLILPSEESPDEEDDHPPFIVPASILDGLMAVQAAGPALAVATMNNRQADGPLIQAQWADDGAKQIYRDLSKNIKRRENRVWYARTAEMAVRLATIVAIGIDPAKPIITQSIMTWARDLAEWSGDRLVRDARRHMARGDFETTLKKTAAFMREKGRATIGDINRRLEGIPTRMVEDIIRKLLESDQIDELAKIEGRRGRPTRVFDWVGD